MHGHEGIRHRLANAVIRSATVCHPGVNFIIIMHGQEGIRHRLGPAVVRSATLCHTQVTPRMLLNHYVTLSLSSSIIIIVFKRNAAMQMLLEAPKTPYHATAISKCLGTQLIRFVIWIS